MSSVRLSWYAIIIVSFLAAFAATFGVAAGSWVIAHL